MFCIRRTQCVTSVAVEILQHLSKPCGRPSLIASLSTSRHTVRHLFSSQHWQKDAKKSFAEKINSGPSLEHFIVNDLNSQPIHEIEDCEDVPYLSKDSYHSKERTVYFETYGCQMNVSDMDLVWTILKKNGYQKADGLEQSDVVLVMTCAIREGAEQKIWKRLHYLKHLKKLRHRDTGKPPMKIGILGCMAERLKNQIVEKEKMVDVVCGPDAYRDLPRLLAVTDSGLSAVNVQLSLEETYADIIPVRINSNSKSAFVSIQRGCDNMCTYCIVPFTRGRERSR